MTRRAVGAMLPAVAYGTAYGIAIVVGRATRVDGSQISLVWPAAAVAVLWGMYAAGLSRRGAAVQWAMLLAVTGGVSMVAGSPWGQALWFCGVNLALAGIATALLCRGGRTVTLQDPADLGRLSVAIGSGAVVSALLATGWFVVRDGVDPVETFTLYATRNAVTALAGVALVLRLRQARLWTRWRRPAVTPARAAETVLLAAATVWVFGRVFWFDPELPIAFIVMLPSIWVALRFSTTTSTLFLVVAGACVVVPTLLDRGVLRGIAPHEQAVLAQGLVGCLVAVVLVLALFRDSRNDLIGRLRHLAHHDPLTGLANRTLLTERLETALAAGRVGSVGVLLLDLDGFKLVNDAWGHDEGDLLLVEISRRLTELAGPHDTVARLGGDEFVLVHPGVVDPAELHLLGERIRRAVALPYGDAADAPYDRITASIGYAVSERDSTPRSLVNRADQAMYDAKRAGRDRTSGLGITVEAAPSAR